MALQVTTDVRILVWCFSQLQSRSRVQLNHPESPLPQHLHDGPPFADVRKHLDLRSILGQMNYVPLSPRSCSDDCIEGDMWRLDGPMKLMVKAISSCPSGNSIPTSSDKCSGLSRVKGLVNKSAQFYWTWKLAEVDASLIDILYPQVWRVNMTCSSQPLSLNDAQSSAGTTHDLTVGMNLIIFEKRQESKGFAAGLNCSV